MRLKGTESLLVDLQAALPTYHNHRAAMEAYQTSRNRASQAADGLRAAKKNWARTLADLGLSESMSPTSVRKLMDGYETLQSSLRRVEELSGERVQREKERLSLAQRIETLYVESLEIGSESANDESEVDSYSEMNEDSRNHDSRKRDSRDNDSRNHDSRNDSRNRDSRNHESRNWTHEEAIHARIPSLN